MKLHQAILMKFFFPMKTKIVLFFLFVSSVLLGQTKVGGKVTDEFDEPIAFANVIFKNSKEGVITDENGNFYFESKENYSTLVVSYVGFEKKEISLKPGLNSGLKIKLQSGTELKEVVIYTGKTSKKNNPAIDILRKIWERRRKNGLKMFKQYEYDKYEKVEFDLNTIDSAFMNSKVFKGMEFVFDQIDTSSISGKTYLPIFINETLSEVYGDNEAKKTKEITKANKNSGFGSGDGVNTFIKDLYADFDIYDNYLKLLLLLVELADVAVWDEQRRLLESEHKTSRFGENQVILALRNLPNFENEIIRRDLRWTEDDQNFIRKLFLDAVLPDTEFQSYLRTSKHNFEEDLAIVVYILKTFILKHHSVVAYFEEKDLNWGENKDVLKSLTTKTFKIQNIAELVLQPLALNWDDDKFYFTDLFDQTLNNDDEYEKIIIEQTKNWEADRLAMTDMIILKMGLAEMIHFSSIPVKVSINEYIELAKNYSLRFYQIMFLR